MNTGRRFVHPNLLVLTLLVGRYTLREVVATAVVETRARLVKFILQGGKKKYLKKKKIQFIVLILLFPGIPKDDEENDPAQGKWNKIYQIKKN